MARLGTAWLPGSRCRLFSLFVFLCSSPHRQFVCFLFGKMDDGVLIDAVRHHPELYDKNNAGFKNPAIKQAAWNSIAQVVTASAGDCTARWSTLRERFNKEKRKMELEERSGSGISTSTWALFGSMEFLSPYIRKRKSVSNFPSQNEGTQQEEQELVDDPSAFFNSSGHLITYENDTTAESLDSAPTVTPIVAQQSTSSSPSPRPATPHCASSSSSTHPAAASLPYLGPTGRCKKKKPDEATSLFKETLSNLNKSIALSKEIEKEKGELLDPDSCIARNVEASLKSLPMELRLGFRRKFRDLVQDCEEALYAHEQRDA